MAEMAEKQKRIDQLEAEVEEKQNKIDQQMADIQTFFSAYEC